MSTEWWKWTHSNSGLSPSSSDDLNASNHNSYILCQLCRRSGMDADIPSVCLAKSRNVRARFSCLHWSKASWKCESLSYKIYQRGEANKVKQLTPTSRFCWNAEGACTSFNVSLYDWYYIWLDRVKMLFKLAQDWILYLPWIVLSGVQCSRVFPFPPQKIALHKYVIERKRLSSKSVRVRRRSKKFCSS